MRHNPTEGINNEGGPVPAITIGLPAALLAPKPARDVACEASTIVEALHALVAQAPQLEQRIFYGDRLLVVVTLNGKHLPPALVKDAKLAAGDRLNILMPVAGG
jgi:sulfur carrier protein ThiS